MEIDLLARFENQFSGRDLHESRGIVAMIVAMVSSLRPEKAHDVAFAAVQLLRFRRFADIFGQRNGRAGGRELRDFVEEDGS